MRGLATTQTDADARCAWRLARELEPAARGMLEVMLDHHRFDALVSWVYNIGVGAATGSTLVRLLNAGDAAGASVEFMRWDRAGSRVVLGLRRRRTAEQALFRGATGAAAVALGQAVS